MKEFEKWLDKSYVYVDSNSQERVRVGWEAALEWVLKKTRDKDTIWGIQKELENK